MIEEFPRRTLGVTFMLLEKPTCTQELILLGSAFSGCDEFVLR